MPGGVEGRRGGVYLVNYNADNTLAASSVSRTSDLVIHAAQESFSDGDRDFNAGTFVIREEDNPEADLAMRLDAAATEYGFTAVRTRDEPEVDDARDARAPDRGHAHLDEHPGRRLAARSGWTSTGFRTTTSPYTTCAIMTQLRDSYDVIVMGQTRGNPLSVVRGLQGRRARSRGRPPSSPPTSGGRRPPTTCAAAWASKAS